MNFCESLSRTSNLKYVWQKVRAMSNKFHRKETANSYNVEEAVCVESQINELNPPWCAERPPSLEIESSYHEFCTLFAINELIRL